MGNRPSMQPRPDSSAPAAPLHGTPVWTRFDTPEALERLGERIAAELRRGEAACLSGPLGAGKTTLARGLVRALLDDPQAEVPSPTFTLVQAYETPRLTVAHFDLYRLKRAEEAFELGLDEALDVGAAVIEWSERLGDALPDHRLELRLSADPPPGEAPAEARWVRMQGFGDLTAARVRRVTA